MHKKPMLTGSAQKWRVFFMLLLLFVGMITLMARAAAFPVLRHGDRGAEVREMQDTLRQLGYLAGEADGKFGPETEQAVRRFQQKNGLKEDGIAGNATLSLLYTLAGTAAPTATPAPGGTAGIFGGQYTRIDEDSTADRIILLQQALRSLGYDLKIDGKLGQETRKVIKRFQKNNGLKQDGIAGEQTLQRIEYLLQHSGENAMMPTRALRKGDSGAEVLWLQQKLQQYGYYQGNLDGKFGSGTLNAVKQFQRARGLQTDGVAGSRTYAALTDASSTATAQPTATPTLTPALLPIVTPPPGQTLRKNASGEAVISLQRALAFLDYTTSTLGVYDNDTVAGVRAFQKNNGLPVDGIAGPDTLAVLYGGQAVHGESSANIPINTGKMNPPPQSQIQLLHWYRDIRSTLKNGQTLLAYDPATGLAWTLRIMSRGAHCDVEPLTATDTAIMYRAFGNQNDWGPKGVYIRLPDGRWTIAGTHNFPHGTQTLKNNNFDGQNCVHFLRTMSEAERNDPKDGVKNQKCIRELWKKMTDQEIGEDIE